MPESVDVVIVGSGAAGLAAAVAATESVPAGSGLRVAVVDRAPEAEAGGNTRWTNAYMRVKGDNSIADGFEEDFATFTQGKADPTYVAELARSAPETLEWLRSFGVTYEQYPMYFLTSVRPRVGVAGGGASIVKNLTEAARDAGVRFRYETRAVALTTEGGRVVGVQVEERGVGVSEIRAKAVVIASGGFEGNREMLVEALGEEARELRPIAPGGRLNGGEGIRMALDVGASRGGEWTNFHCEPADPRSRLAEAVVMAYPYGILVNAYGERFIDEGRATVDEWYEQVARAIFSQPGGVAYFLTDAKLDEISGWNRAVLSDRSPYEADSIAEIAKILDIEEEQLARTVASYNAGVQGDESGFDAFRLDGLVSDGDASIRKSNWARRIDRPPFKAWPVVCRIVFTFGGIETDVTGRVVKPDGGAIPGLYAAGEVTGLYHHKYPGSTSVMRALVFGRKCGAAAARYVEAC